MRLSSDRIKYFGFSFAYCLVFFLIRVFSSDTLSPDEAEQYFYAENFELCYTNQAPLVTWILFLINKFSVVDVFSMNLLKYSLFFFFLCFFYLIIEKTVKKELHSSAFLAISLVPLYSFNFHKDLIQSLALACFSTLTVYLSLKLLEDNSLCNYSLLGLSMACGVLSKYNFVFLAIGIVLGILSIKDARTKIMRPSGVLVALASFFILLSPHIYGLIENNFSTIAHATNKANAVDREFFNFISQLHLLADFFLVFALMSMSFVLFKVKAHKSLILRIAFFSFVALLAAIYIMQVKHFMIHWLASIAFLLPIAFFVNLEERFKYSKLIFNSLIIAFLAFTVFASVSSQNKITKNNSREVNFHKIVDQINTAYDKEKVLLVSNNIFLLANLELHGDFDIKWLNEISYDHYLSKKERKKAIRRYKAELEGIDKQQVVVLSKQDIKKERLPKRFRLIYGDLAYKHKFKNRFNTDSKKNFIYFLWEV